MSLSEHVRTLGRGPGRSRDLTQEEAQAAMALMLSGDAAPEAVGALLMLLRMKGETSDEIAGFARAATQSLPDMPHVDLDWPSYAAGRTRGQPWFLLSARLVAMAGHRVLLHGWNGADKKVRAGLSDAGIAMASCPDEAADLLDQNNIAYMPLETLHPELLRLLTLRDVLGLRSCINTVCRMLNPTQASTSVQGVFHPSYRRLQSDAAARLGWANLSVIKGAGGEFEVNPAKDIAVFGLRRGRVWEETCDARLQETRKLAARTDLSLRDIWLGHTAPDFEISVILGTTGLALETLGHSDAIGVAQTLWQNRLHKRAA